MRGIQRSCGNKYVAFEVAWKCQPTRSCIYDLFCACVYSAVSSAVVQLKTVALPPSGIFGGFVFKQDA